eukprot:326284_1
MTDTQLNTYERIDILLYNYYNRFDINRYYNKEERKGLFLQFVEDEELVDDDISIDDELGHHVNPTDCIYLEFDLQNFPIPEQVKQYDRKLVVFYVLQYLYEYNMLPNYEYLEFKLSDNSKPLLQTTSASHTRCKLLDKCLCFQRLKYVMTQYNDKRSINLYIADISRIIDDFIHLMHEHNDAISFEEIYNAFDFCDLQTCSIYKDRNKQFEEQNISKLKQSVIDLKNYQILNKIHCYFQHSYDIEHRMTTADILLFNNIINTADNNSHLENKPLSILNNILSNSRNKYDKKHLNNRLNKKYISLSKQEHKENKYHFGFHFIYAHDDINNDNCEHHMVHLVYQKHNTLKEELVSNDISTLSIHQFDIEYAKAVAHFNTTFCKQHFVIKQKNHAYDKWNFCIDHVLSLMVYCNYTNLQYDFSKTYRTFNGDKHSCFYHMGKSLKNAIHQFGTILIDSKCFTFYHGMGEHLIFPQYIGLYVDGICINSPLSTSTSFEVAMGFTNNNNGLIVEFGDTDKVNSIKYFSAAWLSDFASEKEYLFIQNHAIDGRLAIHNIFDIRNNYVYKEILNALAMIQGIVVGGNGLYIDSLSKQNIMAMEIIKQLQSSSGLNFTSYGNGLINTYFNNQLTIELDYQTMENYGDLELVNVFFYPDYDWIKLIDIHKLFPNLKEIVVKNVNLCAFIMENTLLYLHNISKISNSIIQIMIKTNDVNELSMETAFAKYKHELSTLNYTLTLEANRYLCINHVDQSIVHKLMIENLYIGNFYRLANNSEIDVNKSHHIHIWTMFISTSPNKLINSKSIKQVIYHLHHTFHPNVFIVKEPPFKPQKQGWGRFMVTAKIQFYEQYNRKEIISSHYLGFDEDIWACVESVGDSYPAISWNRAMDVYWIDNIIKSLAIEP